MAFYRAVARQLYFLCFLCNHSENIWLNALTTKGATTVVKIIFNTVTPPSRGELPKSIIPESLGNFLNHRQRPTGGARSAATEVSMWELCSHSFWFFLITFWLIKVRFRIKQAKLRPIFLGRLFYTSFKASFRHHLRFTLPRDTELFQLGFVCLSSRFSGILLEIK